MIWCPIKFIHDLHHKHFRWSSLDICAYLTVATDFTVIFMVGEKHGFASISISLRIRSEKQIFTKNKNERWRLLRAINNNRGSSKYWKFVRCILGYYNNILGLNKHIVYESYHPTARLATTAIWQLWTLLASNN